MAITPAPGWMIDPNNPNGVIPSSSYVPPQSSAPVGAVNQNPTAGNVTSSPSTTPPPAQLPTYSAPPPQPQAKPTLTTDLYNQARSYISSGAMTPQQAQQYLQGYISSGAYSGNVDNNQLYAPLSLTQNGAQYNLNPDGSLKLATATVNNNIVSSSGTAISQSLAIAHPISSSSVAPPTTTLQPGSTDTASVTALQNYLVANGYMTQAQVNTGPGVYGPQTTAAVAALQAKLGVDNSTGVGYFGPKTLAAIQAASTAPTQTSIGNPVIPPNTSGVAPTLPNATAPTLADQFNTSLSTTLQSQTAQLAQELQTQTANYQSKIDALNQQTSEYRQLESAGLANENSTVAAETSAKQAALEQEQQQFEQNYTARQALVDQLSTLLTTGQSVIQEMQQTTGLSSIMSPRIAKTMTDVQAQAGVITATLSAMSDQIGLAQNQLKSATDAITSIYGDQISYWQSVVSFYDSQAKDTTSQISSLTAAQKTYVDAQIQTLQDKITSTQTTATIIQKAMLDPTTALAYSKAGVTLSDSPEQINAKLAVYEQAQQNVWSAPKLVGGDYIQTNNLTGETRTVVSNVSNGGGTTPSSGAYPRGTMPASQYVDLALRRLGLTYAQAVAQIPKGQMGVIDNATGQVGSIPPTEYTTKKYTQL